MAEHMLNHVSLEVPTNATQLRTRFNPTYTPGASTRRPLCRLSRNPLSSLRRADGKHRSSSVHSSLSGLSSQGVNSTVSWPLPQRPGNSPGALDSPVCLPIGEIQSSKSTDSYSVELWDLVRTNQQRTRGFWPPFRVAHTGDVPPSKVYKLD